MSNHPDGFRRSAWQMRYLDTEQIIAMKGNVSAPWIEANMRMKAGRRLTPSGSPLGRNASPIGKPITLGHFSTASILTGPSSRARGLSRIQPSVLCCPDKGVEAAPAALERLPAQSALRICLPSAVQVALTDFKGLGP
jgi:hypothetical protein